MTCLDFVIAPWLGTAGTIALAARPSNRERINCGIYSGRLASMSQSNHFPADLHAPPDWVRQVEGKLTARADWRDGSYGNDAAPSWILVDGSGLVHAQAFFYTTTNAERFEKPLGHEPYVAVSIIRDNEIVESCTTSPNAFLAALEVAARHPATVPIEALRQGLNAVDVVAWNDATGRKS